MTQVVAKHEWTDLGTKCAVLRTFPIDGQLAQPGAPNALGWPRVKWLAPKVPQPGLLVESLASGAQVAMAYNHVFVSSAWAPQPEGMFMFWN